MSFNEQMQAAGSAGSAPMSKPADSSEGAPFVPGAAGGIEQPFGMESSDAPRRKINQGVVLLLIVLAVAGGALYAMRKGGSASIDTSIADVELKIETALAQVGVGESKPGAPAATAGVLAVSTESVIARFTADPSTQQVPVDQVQKNPFVMVGATAASSAAVIPSASLEDRQKERRLNELRNELSTLELQTVMSGRQPIAVISGRVLRQNEQIGSFTVTAIEAGTVLLTAEGNSYQLTMQQPQMMTN